jgi:hypothetical protein
MRPLVRRAGTDIQQPAIPISINIYNSPGHALSLQCQGEEGEEEMRGAHMEEFVPVVALAVMLISCIHMVLYFKKFAAKEKKSYSFCHSIFFLLGKQGFRIVVGAYTVLWT